MDYVEQQNKGQKLKINNILINKLQTEPLYASKNKFYGIKLKLIKLTKNTPIMNCKL